MKILALLILLGSPAGATMTGCQDTSGPLVLAKPRQTATGTQPIGCINYTFDILSASVAFVGSSVTHPQIWVSTIAGRNGSGLYLSSYTVVGSSVYIMGHAQFGSSLTLTNGAGIGGAVTFNGSSVTVRGEVLSSTLTAHAAYILNAATFGSSVTLRDGEAIGGVLTFRGSSTTVQNLLVRYGFRATTGSFTSGLTVTSMTVADALPTLWLKGLNSDAGIKMNAWDTRPEIFFTVPTSGALANGEIDAADLWLNASGGNITSWGLHSMRSTLELTSGQAITGAATFRSTQTFFNSVVFQSTVNLQGGVGVLGTATFFSSMTAVGGAGAGSVRLTQINGNSAYGMITFAPGSNNTTQAHITSSEGDTSLYLGAGTGSNIHFTAGGANIFNIYPTGKTAIGGNFTPQSMLDVEGGVAIGATYSGTTAAPTNGAIIEGNLGIGTAAPTAAIHVASGTAVMKFDGITLGDDESINLSTNFCNSGMLTVAVKNYPACTWVIEGNNGSSTLAVDPRTMCASADTDTKLAVFWASGSDYTLKNRLGTAYELSVFCSGFL